MNHFEELIKDFKTGNITLMDLSKDEISWKGKKFFISFKTNVVDIFENGRLVWTFKPDYLKNEDRQLFLDLKNKAKEVFFSDPKLISELSQRNTKHIFFEEYEKIIKIEDLLW